MAEQFANNCLTYVSGDYTAGSGILNVASTGAPWPQSATFHVGIFDQNSKQLKVILVVSAINSATQWAVSAEGSDANANDGDLVFGTMITAQVLQNLTPSGLMTDVLQDVDFTQASGQIAKDSTGRGNHAWLSASGMTGAGGVTTNGSSNWIDAGRATVGRYTFTVAVKFKTQSNSSTTYYQEPCIWGCALNGSGYDGGVTVHNGKFAAWGCPTGGGDWSAASNVTVNDNNWHTVVMVSDGATWHFYVDGADAGISTSGVAQPLGDRPGSQVGVSNPWMGRVNSLDIGGAYGYMAATFAHLKVWGRALSAAEVAALVL